MPPDVNSAVVGAMPAPAKIVEYPEVQREPRKTITNWAALHETKLYPTMIKCEGYFPMHAFNSGCHTVMNLKPEQLLNHVESEHGGGFFLSFRENVMNDPMGARTIKSGYWDGWLKLQELGLEIRDLRCDICDQQISVNSRSILRHLKPHAGKSSRVKPGGDFLITLSKEIPQDSIIDEE